MNFFGTQSAELAEEFSDYFPCCLTKFYSETFARKSHLRAKKGLILALAKRIELIEYP